VAKRGRGESELYTGSGQGLREGKGRFGGGKGKNINLLDGSRSEKYLLDMVSHGEGKNEDLLHLGEYKKKNWGEGFDPGRYLDKGWKKGDGGGVNDPSG